MFNNMQSSCSESAMTAFLGFVATSVGSFLMLAAADIIAIDPQSLHAPRWVLGAIGLMFFLAGLMVIAQGIAGPGADQVPIFQWLQYFLVLGVLASFAAVFIWIGLGAGEREFQSSGSLGPISLTGQGSEILGRCMFGGFGILMGIGTLWFAISRPLQIMGRQAEDPVEQISEPGEKHD